MSTQHDSEGGSSPIAAENARVRRLALAIAGDPHGAEDLAQDAWLVLLHKSPREPARLSTWLGGTMRNILRLKGRTDARRVERERAVSRPEAEVADLALERFEMHRAILEAVNELKEPYRTTVLLRWFEELEPAEIALKTGVPVRTVHTRVTRALAILRTKLGSRWGSAGPFGLSALVAWLGGMQVPHWKGALAMQTKTKVALAVAVLAAALVIPIVVVQQSSRGLNEDFTNTKLAVLPKAGGLSEQPAAPPTRQSVIEAPDGDPQDEVNEAALVIVGKTVDSMGNPIPFVPFVVACKGRDGEQVQSDGSGAFTARLGGLARAETAEIRFEGGDSSVVVLPQDFSVVCSATSTIDGVLVYCTKDKVVVRGRLLFSNGNPVPGGCIRQNNIGPGCLSDQQGFFELTCGAWGGSISLAFGTNEGGLFSVGSAGLSLTKSQIDAGRIEGLVLRIPVVDCDGIVLVTGEDGHPIEGAQVMPNPRRAGQETLTNSEGVATIRFARTTDGVWVGKKGFTEKLVGLHRLECGETLTVELPSEAICRGRVVDGLGEGIPGATVEVGNPDFPGFFSDQWTIAGQDGRFSFKVAANAAYSTLLAKTKNGLVGKANYQWARSKGGDVLITVEERCVIAGLVLDDEGNPVPDANISSVRDDVVDVAYPQDTTDHLGAFRLGVEETGTYTVRAAKRGYSRGVGSAKCGDQLVLRLERPCYVSGRVRSKAGGASAPFRVRVLAELPGGGAPQPITLWSTFVDSETFVVEVDSLKEGDPCTVEIGSDSLGKDTLRAPATASRTTSFELDITLE